jgi:sulfur relay (sulfurtransferase) DsrC/TusE family protein
MSKKEKIEIRVTILEKKIILKKAQNAALSTSEYVRSSALNQNISYKLTEEELEVYKMLKSYYNNFQRIGNILKEKDTEFAKEIMKTSKEIREHLAKIER